MIDGVTNGFAPTSRNRNPQEVRRDIEAARKERRYQVLDKKEQSGNISDVEKFELYLLKAEKIADKLIKNTPVIY